MGSDNYLWVESYRPKTIEECILPDDLKATFKEFVENGSLPNLLLAGGPGIGKTTVARALCEEMNVDYILVNGSEDGNIDTLRTKIRNYASTVSFSASDDAEFGKVIILDEATSALDGKTEKGILDSLEPLQGDKTILIITHRPSSLKICSKVFEISAKGLIKA